MGLQPIIQGHWFEIGPDYESSMAEKHRLLSTYHDLCIMSLPEVRLQAAVRAGNPVRPPMLTLYCDNIMLVQASVLHAAAHWQRFSGEASALL